MRTHTSHPTCTTYIAPYLLPSPPRSFLLPALRPFGGLSWHLACLSPPSAASLFAAALVNWERAAAGLTPATLWLPVTPAGGFSAGSALLALVLDVLLYGLLAWYLDKVRGRV